jgi:hypothetical protein
MMRRMKMPKLYRYAITRTSYGKGADDAIDKLIDDLTEEVYTTGINDEAFEIEVIREEPPIYTCGFCNADIPEHEWRAYDGWCSVCTQLFTRKNMEDKDA